MAGIITAAVVSTAGAVYGAKKSKEAAKDAANLQREAADEGIQFQREALAQLRQDLQPYNLLGRSVLQPLTQQLGFSDSYARTLADQAVQDQIGSAGPFGGAVAAGITPRPAQPEGFTDQFKSDPQKMARYRDQLAKVNSMQGNEPNYAQEARLLEGLESQLPIEDLVSIEPQTPLAKERLSNYYREKGITPPSGVTQMNQGQVGTQMTASQPGQQPVQPLNPLLAQAVQERAAFDPLQNPLFARAAQERADFDPMANPLLAQAVQEQQAYDPNAVLGPDLLQNPLLQALQADVTRRLTANQAARGRLGSGGTAEELQNRIVPQAINFGLQLDQLQRQAIGDRARLGFDVLGAEEAAITGRENTGLRQIQLQESAIAGRESTGAALEDLRQRQINNLLGIAQLGQASAAQTGTSGLNVASNIGQLGTFGAQAQALGELQQAKAVNQGIGALTGGVTGVIGRYGPGFRNPDLYGINTTGGLGPNIA